MIGIGCFVVLLACKITKQRLTPTPERLRSTWYRALKVFLSGAPAVVVVVATIIAETMRWVEPLWAQGSANGKEGGNVGR